MSEEERNKQVVRRMLEVFNSGDVGGLDEVADPNLVSHNPHPGTEPTREGLKRQIQLLREAFPDAHFKEETMIAEGDKVFLHWTMRGTHMGRYEDMGPTSKPMTHEGKELFRIADGKIVEHYGEESNLEFRQKLGQR
jgi:predicted ester cyclase